MRGASIDSSAFHVEIDSARADDGRAWLLTYETPVEAIERYDIVLRAVDAAGRAGTFTLSVVVDVSVTFDGTSIAAGDLVSPAPLIRVEVVTPLPVEEEEITVTLDRASLDADSLDHPDDFRWILSMRPEISGGEHELVVAVRGQSKTFLFRVDDAFRVAELLNYPNPFDGETGFYYELSRNADAVEAEIFTVAGRRIRRIVGLGGRAGYNGNPDVWDGRDEEGDRVANGVYIYRVTAHLAGEKATALGKAVLRKEPGK